MAAITRLIALVLGLVLVGYPALPISTLNSTGRGPDYQGVVYGFLAIHGGVLLGMLVYWLNRNRMGRGVTPLGLFRAGFFAELVLSVTVLLGRGFYSLMASGSFGEGIGNLWPLVLILWLMAGTAVAGGVALLFYAWKG